MQATKKGGARVYGRHTICARFSRVVLRPHRIRVCMRQALAPSDELIHGRIEEDNDMGLEYIVTGIIALLVGVYLMIALLRPDLF